MKLILISCAFAFPLAYYLTVRWPDGFAYKMQVSWWMIVLSGLIVRVTTLLTVAGQAVRAAMVNPAKSLRND